MTELVIKEHEKEVETDRIFAGQLRSDEYNRLILVTERNSDETFNAIYLKNPKENMVFKQVHSTNGESSNLMREFPHVIESARITVDLNER